MTEDFKRRLSTLTERERRYFNIMFPKSGVLFISSRPGIAKSAIARSIGRKMGYEYQDMRLSMSDETDFKFPFITDMEYGGSTVKVSGYTVPEWAYRANQRPTIIHFEELNRAPQFVRNAALQILLEREIGSFKFNDNVLMMASGNLGDEDGTDVEEFDSALNNRLIHYPHTLEVDEWLDNFAIPHKLEKIDLMCDSEILEMNKMSKLMQEGGVHPLITNYIKTHREELYKDPEDGAKAYATPRSWTFLSNYIKSYTMLNDIENTQQLIPELAHVAVFYIGSSFKRFIRYCEDSMLINIDHIINDYDGVKKKLKDFNRDKSSELLASLKERDITKLDDKQMSNVVAFLKERVDEDELTGYLYNIVKLNNVSEPRLKDFLLNFRDILESIYKINEPHVDSGKKTDDKKSK